MTLNHSNYFSIFRKSDNELELQKSCFLILETVTITLNRRKKILFLETVSMTWIAENIFLFLQTVAMTLNLGVTCDMLSCYVDHLCQVILKSLHIMKLLSRNYRATLSLLHDTNIRQCYHPPASYRPTPFATLLLRSPLLIFMAKSTSFADSSLATPFANIYCKVDPPLSTLATPFANIYG